jgi:hypothetical protein
MRRVAPRWTTTGAPSTRPRRWLRRAWCWSWAACPARSTAGRRTTTSPLHDVTCTTASRRRSHMRARSACRAIEPLHPMYAADRACVNTLAQALDICDALDPSRSGALGVALDVYHVWWDPQLQAQIARAGHDRLLAFHVCDWRVPTRDLLTDRAMMGDGVIEIARIRSWVEEAGYSGFSEVEIFSSLDWDRRDGAEVLDTCIERHRRCV